MAEEPKLSAHLHVGRSLLPAETMQRSLLWVPLVFAAAACSDDPPENPLDAGTSGDSGFPADAAESPGDGGPKNRDSGQITDAGFIPEGEPILDRTPRNDYGCQVNTNTTALPDRWAPFTSSLATAGEKVWSVRAQSDGLDWNLPTDFVLSTLEADGTFGPDLPISSADPSTITRVQLVPTSGGAFAVLWIENTTAIRFASFDASGAVVTSPKTLSTVQADSGTNLRAEYDGAGSIGLFYSRTVNDGSSLHFLTLDESGNGKHTPVTVASSNVQVYLRSINIAAHDADGFGLLYADGTGFDTDLYYSRITADGTQRVSERLLYNSADRGGVGGGFAPGNVALLKNATGFLAAWSEGSFGNFETQTGAYSVVRLARIDLEGAIIEHAVMRSKIDSVEQTEPDLTRFRGAVAVSWARGSVIYVCGGCIPDHSIEAVLIDPDTLAPVSNSISVAPNAGGLLRRDVAVLGSNLLTTFEITFHVSSDPGFASFGCD